MKHLMSFIFIGLYSLSAFSSEITLNELRSLEGEYVGVQHRGSGTCVAKVSLKHEKITFTIESDDIVKYVEGYSAGNLPTLSSDPVKLMQFVQDSTGSMGTTLSYSNTPGLIGHDKTTWLTFNEKELSSVSLYERKVRILDFYRPAKLEISADCYDLKKVR